MKELQQLAKEQKNRYYTLIVLAVATGAVIITQAYLIATIVDDIFLNQVAFKHVLWPLAILFIVLLGRSSLTYGIGTIGVRMAAIIKQEYRQKLLSAYANHSLLTSYQGQSGEKISIMMDAVDELDSFFSKYIPQRMLTTAVPVMILIVIFTQHMYSGLIILLTAPFIPVFMIIIGKYTQRKSEEQLDRLTDFSGRFLDTLQGFVSLKIFGRVKQQRELIRQSSIDFRDSTMSLLKIAFTSSLMLEYISMLSIGLVALELGLRLVVFEQINFYTAFLILLLVPEFFSSLKELGSAFHAGRSSMGAAAKVNHALQHIDHNLTWGNQRLLATPPSIELKNVGFRYRPDDNEDGFALRDITVRITPHQQTVIVGKSGSGKTTLLHILAGLILPLEGEVQVNGQLLIDFSEQEWFRHISYITQHPYLFSGTIEENIALGSPHAVTHADIKYAASKAGINDTIEALPDGYSTTIGEGGRGLSGGEQQRVALARAFLKKPSIVLFDEPTTGLDLYTEQILQNSIQELAQTSTVITVAHRIQTIKQARQVLYIAEGALVAVGTHTELMKTDEGYQALFSRQKEAME